MTSLSIVGHSDDLGAVARTWSRYDRARIRTVVITGAAGVSKSRLWAVRHNVDPADGRHETETALAG